MRGKARAQDIVEYGLLVVVIALVVLVGANAFGNEILAWIVPLIGRVTTTGT